MKYPTALPLLCAFGLTAAAGLTHAAEPYPSKPVRIVIGYTPGGPTDAVGRVIFTELSRRMGQPMVIENRPGVAGAVAADFVAKAPADGYTLLYGTSAMATIPSLYKRPDMEPAKFMTAVACTVGIPFALLVAPTLPVKTPEELSALIKQSPGKYFQGSSGNGTTDHLTGVMVAKALGWQYNHVPYKGNAGVLTDLAAGNVNYMFAGALQSALPLVKDGRMRLLAVTSAQRASLLPDTPTISETLIKGFDTSSWQALMAPLGTPAAIVEQLNGRLNEVLADPVVKEKLQQQGADTIAQTPADCGNFIQKEYVRWSGLIRANNVSIE